MSETESPLGKREGPALEFKRREILQSGGTGLASLGRAVAAMLNSTQCGTVWVGVAEADERAVGLQQIDDASRHVRRIEDHLLDALEPSPQSGEVAVRLVSVSGQDLIRIEVGPTSRRPFAQLRGNGLRLYVTRVGGRIRTMSREEIRAAFHDATSLANRRIEKLEEAWGEEIETNRSGLWVGVEFDPELDVLPDLRSDLEQLFSDPKATGNRTMGWNFCTPHDALEIAGQGFGVGDEDTYTSTTVARDGGIRFRAPMSRLEHKAAGQIWPYALVEFPVSVMRLAAGLARLANRLEAGSVFVDAGLTNAGRVTLRPYSPRAFGHELDARSLEPGSAHTGPREHLRSVLDTRPDQIGWELVRGLYQAFGFWPEQLPQELWAEDAAVVAFPR